MARMACQQCVGRVGQRARTVGASTRVSASTLNSGGSRPERHQVQAPLEPAEHVLVLDRLDRVRPVGAVVVEPVEPGIHDANRVLGTGDLLGARADSRN